jgi:hypothetical protein
MIHVFSSLPLNWSKLFIFDLIAANDVQMIEQKNLFNRLNRKTCLGD